MTLRTRSRLWLLAGLLLAPMLATIADEKTPAKTLGTIEVKDPAFAALIPKTATVELLAEAKFKWSEGPVWNAKTKTLLFSDIPRNMIWSWNEVDGLKEYLTNSGYTGKAEFTGSEPGCNGLAYNKDGELLLCQHGNRCVAKLTADKKFVVLADKYDGKRLNSPNDLVLHSNGDIYFTDPPYGLPKGMDDPAKELDFQGVYRLDTRGKVTLLTKEMSRPNGIAFSPDEKTLYVANSDPKLSYWKKFAVAADGTIGKGEIFADTTSCVGKDMPGLPDGMKVDVKGNVFATGPGGVLVISPEGKLLGLIKTGVPTANVGWGDDGSTLYITADTNLVRVKTKTMGKK